MLNRILIVLVTAALALTSVALAGVPDKLGKQAARKTASAVINECNETADAVACLREKGCDCVAISDGDATAYRCSWKMSVEATQVRTHDAAPAERLWWYEITYHLKEGRNGWRGKTKSIKELKD